MADGWGDNLVVFILEIRTIFSVGRTGPAFGKKLVLQYRSGLWNCGLVFVWLIVTRCGVRQRTMAKPIQTADCPPIICRNQPWITER